ncbi:MAG TPA: magnesium transporter [Gemmatimonas aurantiaca]|uniref:Magnesium transporter MgtE n=2 Tax=Gemmatimonas aurantiaca TaxID=173480 RepID=C1AAE8_GEMAT|nr:magnesium transporter [Gemmatimonas aurantiaca]BAH39746.1 magnesium transporter [Gemmatimonas aurantiaca T-27]HCT58244.1 magnesium transporter [Gemmatimonas aurantiaca]
MTPRANEDRPLAALIAPDLLELLEEHPESIGPQTEEMHPADLADVAEALPEDQVRAFLAALPRERAAEVMEYLNEDLRTQVLEALSAQEAAEIVAEMTPDERADALEELDEETADEILQELEPEDKAATERLLQYDPYTAGGLMTTEFVSVEETLTVEESLRAVRAMARAGRREAMYTIYTTDLNGRLRGVLSLRELLAAPEGSRISEHAWTDVVSVAPDTAQEAVSQLTSNYDLVAVPVVDLDHRLLGVVTVDDVIDVIQEEQTEDAQKFGGMEALEEPYMQISLWQNVRKRAGWLSVLAISEMFTASAMAHYQTDIDRATMLAQFVPLIISSGGNSGSQATSLIIRAMALGEVHLRDWWRIVLRELPAGLALGVILGLLAVGRILTWQELGLYDYGAHHLLIALTVGVSLVGIVAFGSLTGSMLPFILRRLGFDPASASAPFVATLVDVAGISIYFSVAYMVLSGTLL